jgi:hypothetical protein
MLGILSVMFGNFFGNATHRETIAVADIGSGSAGFAIVEVGRGPSIVHVAERAILPIEKRDENAAMAAISLELERIGKKLLSTYATKRQGAPMPQHVLCVIRAPWTRSEAVKEIESFEALTLVTHAMVKRGAQQALARTTIPKSDFLDAAIARVELNGYPTKHPEGRYAKSVSTTSLISGCNTAVRASVDHALQSVLPHATRSFRSGSRVLLSLLREYSAGQDYLVADVSGESTTIIAVRDDAPAEHSLVSEGIYGILRRLSSTGMPEEILGIIRMITRDDCVSEACTGVEQALAKIEPELVKVFGEGMAECAVTRRLPNRLFLVTHQDMAVWLKRFFERIDFTQFTKTAQPFEVIALAPKDMEAWIKPAPGVSLDCGLAVPAALVNIERGISD